MTMTLLDALGDEDDALPPGFDARAAAAAAPAAMVPRTQSVRRPYIGQSAT